MTCDSPAALAATPSLAAHHLAAPARTLAAKAEVAAHADAADPEAEDLAADAFARDVLAHAPALRAFAWHFVSQEADAEDLVQQTILRALIGRRHFCPGTNLKAWLFTIQRNSFNSRWRTTCRETMPGGEFFETFAVEPATQEGGLYARQVLDRMMRELSPAHREMLILVPVQGLSYEDAAERCGCSVGTVKSRINRARAALGALGGEERP